MLKATFAASLALTTLAGAAHAQLFIPVNPYPVGQVVTRDISADGLVATGVNLTAQQSFIWPIGQAVQPFDGLPGYISTSAEGISGDGLTVYGRSKETNMASSPTVPIMWTEATGTLQLQLPPDAVGSGYTYASTHDASRIYGIVQTGPAIFKHVIWTAPDQVEYLPDSDFIVGAGDIVCSSNGDYLALVARLSSGPASTVFIWNQNDGYTNIGTFTSPFDVALGGISDDGSVVVGYTIDVSSSRDRGFRWTEETGVVFFGTSLISSGIYDMTADGTVMIGSTAQTNYESAVLNPDGTGITINDYADMNGIDRDGWDLFRGETISDNKRTITGFARRGAEFSSYALVIPCTSDYNADGTTDILDLLDFLSDFDACNALSSPCGTLGNPDLNNDGTTDVLDLLDFLDALASGC